MVRGKDFLSILETVGIYESFYMGLGKTPSVAYKLASKNVMDRNLNTFFLVDSFLKDKGEKTIQEFIETTSEEFIDRMYNCDERER